MTWQLRRQVWESNCLGADLSSVTYCVTVGQESELSVPWNPICTVGVTTYLPELLGRLTVVFIEHLEQCLVHDKYCFCY